MKITTCTSSVYFGTIIPVEGSYHIIINHFTQAFSPQILIQG